MDSTVQQSELQSTSQTTLDARSLLSRLATGRVLVVDYLREKLCPRGSFSRADRDLVMYKGLAALVEQTIKVDPKQVSNKQSWELTLQWDGALTAVLEVTGGSLRQAENYPPLMEALKQIQTPTEVDRLEYYIVNMKKTSARDQAVRALATKIINEADGRLGSQLPPMEFAEIALPDMRSLRRQLGAELRETFDQGEERALDHFKFHVCSEVFALDKLDHGAVLHFAFRELVSNIEDSFVAQNLAAFEATAEALNAALGLLEGLEAERRRVESTNTATPFFQALTSVAEERHSHLTGFRYAYKRLEKGARRDLCSKMVNMAVKAR